ncbi:MAG TPA: TolC family protein [Methylomirabilota bacterium]|nr:TolC family protein [Methylomirabilota bacterium]
MRRCRLIGLSLLLLGTVGCASVTLDAGFSDVKQAVERRAGATVVWSPGADLGPESAEHVQGLLQQTLTVDAAVQVALLNNRNLQAMYAELGVARSDLVQAGLFKNPVIDAAILFPVSGARPDLQLGVAVSLLDALYVPLRKRVAASRFEGAKLWVTGAVLDFAAQVRAAFYVHQADEQLVELRRTIAQALKASFEVSRRLYAAGNISDLDLARERAQMEMSRLGLRRAEVNARLSREQLNELMGLWGEQTRWDLDARMPEIPAAAATPQDVERSAVDRSLDLLHARQRIVSAGQQLGYSRASALTPDLDSGVEAEKDGGEAWKLGPAISIPLPIFDQGQARIARGATELRRAQQEYYALAVRIRSTARAVQDRLDGARDRAMFYKDILLPLRERIVNEAQLQYNAMQIGIFPLLRAREDQIETAAAYVEALREYWLAATDQAAIASGRLPGQAGSRAARGEAPGRMRDPEGH